MQASCFLQVHYPQLMVYCGLKLKVQFLENFWKLLIITISMLLRHLKRLNFRFSGCFGLLFV
jgi:hypothetical protein